MEVTIDIDKDYKDYLEKYYSMPIEDMLTNYVNDTAESLIGMEYEKIKVDITVKDKLDKIKIKQEDV